MAGDVADFARMTGFKKIFQTGKCQVFGTNGISKWKCSGGFQINQERGQTGNRDLEVVSA